MDELMAALSAAGKVENGMIVLERSDLGSQAVDPLTFEGFFGLALKAEDRYTALLEADGNADGSSKGYRRFFDVWHEMGIV